MAPAGFADNVAFVWKVADKLRGTFKQHELRLGDAAAAGAAPDGRGVGADQEQGRRSREGVGDRAGVGPAAEEAGRSTVLQHLAADLASMLNDDVNLAEQLGGYIRGLSKDAYAVMQAYNVDDKIARLDRAQLLYAVVADFADLDLSPGVVRNEAMGYIVEELLRKFSEMSNETAGKRYTPREVIALMVDLLLTGEASAELTANPKPVRTVYDPAAGTGGMLMGALQHIRDRNTGAVVRVYGQELNDETWAIAQSDLMMQGIDPKQMANGNSLTGVAFSTQHFDFVLANPPYGVDWKGYAKPIKDERAGQGYFGRFGAGLPRVYV